MSASPLLGLKVLDLSKVLAGPLCAQYLGDMGAEVVKIEPIEGGDETRHWPPFRTDSAGVRTGTVYLSANRNKRSLAVDLRQPAGRDVVMQLADQADVVIESFGPGVAAKLGVDTASMRARNQRLICCNISGYGNVGPMRAGKGYDLILQAYCGMLAITGERDGPPVRSPFSPVDQATGLHALIGILALLHERERTGEGGIVEAALFDTATAFLGYFLQGYWERGTEPERPGSGHESVCPYEAFDTGDKPLILGVANDGLWRAFCRIAELGEYVDDPRFRTNADRVLHRKETVALVRTALARRARDEWIAALTSAGIPCSPLHTLGELSELPHTSASGMVYRVDDDRYGSMRLVAQPLRFDGQRSALRRAPPAHGADSEAVLLEAGFSAEQIAALASAGAICLPAETGDQDTARKSQSVESNASNRLRQPPDV
jgi:crotonobetainyl-CoA:carnitine CoA-transferase CaiB-like acyl-CoA transferase